MTALAGCWSFGARDPFAECGRMLEAQHRYGPDNRAIRAVGEVSLGRCLHRLLPEDAHDRQPVVSPTSGRALVADVRLDNREELIRALGPGAPDLATTSDSALLMACLERWDESALDRIVGDFAFALWDGSAHRLLLARDILGQRPLHHHQGDGFFAFASMPCGLHALEGVVRAPDERRIAEFLALLRETAPRTFFEGIGTVAGGEVLTVTREGLARRRYWNPARPPARSERPDADYVEALRDALDEAVRARLRGVGSTIASQLSAGFDSGAVTATAARLLAPGGGSVVAFTAVPGEAWAAADCSGRLADEGPLAAATAALYPNIEHVLVRTANPSDGQHDAHLWRAGAPRRAAAHRLCRVRAPRRGAGRRRGPWLGRAGRCRAGAAAAGSASPAGRSTWRPDWHRVDGAGQSRVGSRACRRRPFRPGRWFCHPPVHARPCRPGQLQQGHARRVGRGRARSHRRSAAGGTVPGPADGPVPAPRGDPLDRSPRPRRPPAPGGAGRAAQRLPGGRLAPCARAARDAIGAEVARIAACPVAQRTLHVARIRALVDHWPLSGWDGAEAIAAYRLALPRALAAGGFVRQASHEAQVRGPVDTPCPA